MKKFFQIVGFTGLILILMGGLISLAQLAMGGRLDQLGERISEIVKYHILLGAALLAIGALASRRELGQYLARGRRLRMGPNILLQAVLILIALAALNMLVSRHDVIRDYTRLKHHELRPATKQVLQGLPGEVEVLAFFRGIADDEARIRLRLFRAEAPDKVKLSFIDPDKHEDIAFRENIPRQEGILFKYPRGAPPGQVRREWITDYEESSITNAFIRVTREHRGKVWFVRGHAEPEADLQLLRNYLTDQGFHLEMVTLLKEMPAIPREVAVVALIGPQLPLAPYELNLIQQYLQDGGSLFVAIDFISFSGLEPLLAAYGIKPDNNLIRDRKHHLANNPSGTDLVVTDLKIDHEITRAISFPNLVFPRSRSLSLVNKERLMARGMEFHPLVRTSEDSFEKVYDTSETPTPESLQELFEARQRLDERDGPFTLAYAIRQNLPARGIGPDREARELRIVVLGTSHLCRNMFIQMPYNWQFALNSFNWLAGEKDLIRFRAPVRGGTRLDLNRLNEEMVFYFSVIILPEIFMIIGVAVWWRRR